MFGYNFIFSHNILFRLSRHLVFWAFISAWYLLLCGFLFFNLNLSSVLVLLFSRLPVVIIATYITLYFLIPRFLFRKKYRQFILSIIIDGPQLIFMLRNNKPNSNTQESQSNTKGGIGLKNVAKRLQLLYPDKHNLKIESADISFSVYRYIMLRNERSEPREFPFSSHTTNCFVCQSLKK